MEIIKILNNNTALVMDKGVEKVAMGRGLAFGKRIKDAVEVKKIGKLYELKGSQVDDLLGEIDPVLLTISDLIVTRARDILPNLVSDLTFISIADHLSGAIKSVKEGIQVKNFLLWDVKKFFPKEFAVGKYGLSQVAERLNLHLPDDEAGFLALHLVNGEAGNENSDAAHLTRLMEEVVTVIKYSLELSLNEEDVYFQRFMTHLKFFAERVLSKIPDRTTSSDEEMLDLVEKKYPTAYQTVGKISRFIEEHYKYEVSINERLYLTIHLARMVAVNSPKEQSN